MNTMMLEDRMSFQEWAKLTYASCECTDPMLLPRKRPRQSGSIASKPEATVPSGKPPVFNGDLAMLPPALEPLTEQDRWVVWAYEDRGGKWTKPPRQANSRLCFAHTDKKETWYAYPAARDTYLRFKGTKVDGIGFCLYGSTICGIDIDHCVGRETGAIDSAAQNIIDEAASYTEISPSGTGIRIFGYGNKTETGRKGKVNGVEVEVYRNTKRYLTVTGRQIGSFKLAPIDNVIDNIVAKLGGITTICSAPSLAEKEEKRQSVETKAQTRDARHEFSRLKAGVRSLIVHGTAAIEAGHSERSQVFHSCVAAMKREGWTIDAIVDVFAKHPDGIGSRYLKDRRLRHEVERCYAKQPSKEPIGPPPLMQSVAELIADFTPLAYLVDGVVQRGYVYSLTGAFGSGKTAVTLRVAIHVALGLPIAGREVEQGTVMYLAGENADDVRMRTIALLEEVGAADPPIVFIPQTFKISGFVEDLAAKAEEVGGVALVVVDTSAAYFEGDNENDNTQMHAHAALLRRLTQLPGKPTVLINSHPVKNAANLLPRGGGAFLGEVDGNLTLTKEQDVVTLHHSEKFRGPDFQPLHFKLETHRSEKLVDAKGRQIPTVAARVLDAQDMRVEEAAQSNDRSDMLRLIEDNPRLSFQDMAQRMGLAHKMQAKRIADHLVADKLVSKASGEWRLTKAGKQQLRNAELDAMAENDDLPF